MADVEEGRAGGPFSRRPGAPAAAPARAAPASSAARGGGTAAAAPSGSDAPVKRTAFSVQRVSDSNGGLQRKVHELDTSYRMGEQATVRCMCGTRVPRGLAINRSGPRCVPHLLLMGASAGVSSDRSSPSPPLNDNRI